LSDHTGGVREDSSNPNTTRDPVTVREAIEVLERTIAHPAHTFWAEDLQLTNSQYIHRNRLQGYRQVTDAYLLAVAIQRDGQIVTFDQGFTSLAPPREHHRIITLSP
jgi:predicted nucleic acid-binding protein